MNKTESEIIEYKKSLSELKEGLISIAAILNKHRHGELWFGIRNDGTVAGLEANEKTLRDISQAIAAHIEPRIYPHVTTVDRDGAACIQITFKGKDAPYYAYGRAYMRVADEDRQLSARELENLILAKNRDKLHWDSEISETGLDDLDNGKLKTFVKLAGLAWDTPSNALEKLGVLKEGRLLNAAPLFFAKNAPMQLRCAVFATTDSATVSIPHQRWGLYENHGPLKDGELKRLSDHHQWWSPFDQQRTTILSHVSIARMVGFADGQLLHGSKH